MAAIPAVTGPLAGDFVPLNTLAGAAGGGATLGQEYLPWVAQQATSRAGTLYALGAEIGPIALCYRSSLLAEAGLPTSPAVLARDWATWPGFLAFGRTFAARIRARARVHRLRGQPVRHDGGPGQRAVLQRGWPPGGGG